jgi:hypothetical protein
MKSVAVALVLSASVMAMLALEGAGLSPLVSAPIAVLIGIVAASVAAGGLTWLTISFGAASPLLLGWVGPYYPTLSLIAMTGLWLAPRAWLTRSQRDLVVLGATAFTGAVVAGLVAYHFAGASFAQHLAACVFAGAALAVSTVVVKVDTPTAHALSTAAQSLEGPVAEALRRAAEAHRYSRPLNGKDATPGDVWRKLARDADARVALRGLDGEDAEGRRAELDKAILAAVAAKKEEPEPELKPSTVSSEKPEPKETVPASPAVEALVP